MSTTRFETPRRPDPDGAAPIGSTPVSERSLAPDLARGMMLLLIALAHVPWFLYTSDIGTTSMHALDGGFADRVAQVLTIVIVDARTHTMFAFLFAYGVGQMYARQISRGAARRDVRRLLRTRHLWMLVFGGVHALLLWQGDIIGAYGMVGLIMVPLFLNRTDRTVKIWIGVLLVLGALLTLLSVVSAVVAPVDPAVTSMLDLQRANASETGYVAAALDRPLLWLATVFGSVFSFAIPTAFLMGILAARHRVLDEPAAHLPLLRWVTFGGISVGAIGGVAFALQHLGLVAFPGGEAALSAVSFYTGIFTGVGYAAMFGLIAHWISSRGVRPGLPVRALVSLGRRSMSGYLAQSVVFIPLLAAWGLGLGAHLSSWSVALVGVGTWLLTVVGAYLLDRAGKRGPAEVALRRLTYRRTNRRASAGSAG